MNDEFSSKNPLKLPMPQSISETPRSIRTKEQEFNNTMIIKPSQEIIPLLKNNQTFEEKYIHEM
tara:strand:+ start:109 stop:300 length:192 start_codon:yes stop_codon:yes gene_type:complete